MLLLFYLIGKEILIRRPPHKTRFRVAILWMTLSIGMQSSRILYKIMNKKKLSKVIILGDSA